MIRKRLGLKALGLCVLAMGVFVFVASAQAETRPEWMVNGAELGAATPAVEISEIEPLPKGSEEEGQRHASLLAKVGTVSVKVLCEEAKLVNIKLVKGGLLSEKGTVTFHKCKTFLNGSKTASKPCEPIVNLGGGVIDHELIVSEPGKGHIALHELEGKKEGVTVIESLVNDKSGMPRFAVIHFAEECSIGEELPVLGKLVLKDALTAPGEMEVEKEAHLISEHPLSELFVIDLEPAHRATIDGSALVRLVAGGKWSGLPE